MVAREGNGNDSAADVPTSAGLGGFYDFDLCGHRTTPGKLQALCDSNNGSAFTARSTRLAMSALGVTHRRGGYRDPASQAFIESWFRYLKERGVWRNEFETLDQARR